MQLSNVWFQGHDVPSFELRHRPVVMLVEQDLICAAAITRHLQKHFEVIGCESGSEALHAVELEPPDVVVVDFDLPDMEGSTLAEKLRHEWTSEVPIVMISGYANHHLLCTDDTPPGSHIPCQEESLLTLLTSIIH